MKDKKGSSILENVILVVLILMLLYKMFFGGCGCSTPDSAGVPDNLTQTEQVQTKD